MVQILSTILSNLTHINTAPEYYTFFDYYFMRSFIIIIIIIV
jgi:hypothetical protein